MEYRKMKEQYLGEYYKQQTVIKKNAAILAIDTSCDETSAAVTEGKKVLSNVLWSQASLHSKFGGVYPSLAKRAHEERIDWVVEKAVKKAFPTTSAEASSDKPSTIPHLLSTKIDAIAVTVGPGLAIALEVGINKAKELSVKYDKPFIPVNHVEGHVLSVFARPKNNPSTKNYLPSTKNFPAIALVASGKHTDLIHVKDVGDYKIVAHTIDDALGEALDKAARMLGLGYPGGPILEKLAKEGDPKTYILPVPLAGQKNRMEFSYSGLKTAMYKLVESEKPLTKEKIENLAAAFQDTAFKHVENLVNQTLVKHPQVKTFFFGGGVSANIELRKRIRNICKNRSIQLLIPYSKALCTDNAAMIGVVAGYKFANGKYIKPKQVDTVDRVPRAKIDKGFAR
jgi:N6-L-threonylcarbamoyladenine synthase